jgi:hypothetical protein
MFKSSTNDSFVMKHEIKCDSLRANEIYAEKINGPTSTVDFTIIDSITGHIENFTCVTGHIDNFSSDTGHIENFTCVTGHIDNFSSDTGHIENFTCVTGHIDNFTCDTIYAATGEIGTLYSNTIYAATGIYSASSFTRDQSTDITVPNISSMYQYYTAGPVTIPIPSQGNVFLNRSSLTGMTGTKGTLIPASAFSVGSLFEFYFAGSFTNNGFSNAKNLVTGSITNSLPGSPNSTKVYLDELINPTKIILCSSGEIFKRSPVNDPYLYNNKKLRIQSIYTPDTYQQYNYQILNIEKFVADYYPTLYVNVYTFTVTYNAPLNSISTNNFIEGDDVIVKFEDSIGPSLNIALTFEENEATYTKDKAICTINLENTIYYKQKHHFTSKSIFNINDINSNTISISSSNSGSIYCHNGNEGDFTSNANTLYKPFNTFDKSYNIMLPFTKNPSNSNTVYPRISVSSFAQNINLEVNNYYLRRIA